MTDSHPFGASWDFKTPEQQREVYARMRQNADDGRPEQRGAQEHLAAQTQLLEEILAAILHANSADRTGAVSSVEVKFLAPTKDYPQGRAQPVVKLYAGSEAPVDEAIIAYAKTVALAERAQMEGWQATLDRIQPDGVADQLQAVAEQTRGATGDG